MKENGILLEQANAWTKIDDDERKKVFRFAGEYKEFLSTAKTERESVDEIKKIALSYGFKPISDYGDALKAGDRVIMENRNKALFLAVAGKENIREGASIIGAHIDAPRLDLKPIPLYEDNELVLLKTHYYGGIKKYQWVTIPLSLHGVIITSEGKTENVVIGEATGEPVFTITDLLPHLAKDQMKKKMEEAITGESLNILAGGIPLDRNSKGNCVKEAILRILYGKYNVTEEDFISAELEAVPAWPARDVGFDSSFIGGYGQDDRVCAYTLLRAICELKEPRLTAVALFVDKEEIGSVGNTSMGSVFFESSFAQLYKSLGEDCSEIGLRKALLSSNVLSADVNAGFDPGYSEVFEKQNTAKIGYGVVLTKYTGARGKTGASDASAEFTYHVRQILNKNGVVWQTGELGKVDQGGGGTIAHLLARYNMDVIDCGPPVLSMHSPFEIASKADVYMTYRAYYAFYNG